MFSRIRSQSPQDIVSRLDHAELEAALGGRFKIISRTAAGGQGVVFRAIRTSTPDGVATDDEVALKIHFHPSQELRVRREVEAMRPTQHPNLARFVEHGLFETAGISSLYIAWRFIEGIPLNVHLKTGPLLESEVLIIGRDICSAIAEIWSQQIVHGDVKPSNIMLPHADGYIMIGAVDSAVLIDLGVATYLNLENSRPASLKPARARDIALLRPLGTMGYFSPEQILGVKTLTCASDVFSLGVVLLQCLMGRHPTNCDQSALVDGFRVEESKAPASASLLDVLNKMLVAQPAARPNPAELSRQFQRLWRTKQAMLHSNKG